MVAEDLEQRIARRQSRPRRRRGAGGRKGPPEFHARGAIAELFGDGHLWCTYPEVLVEGPAGTGKTRGILQWIDYIAHRYAGCRILLTRKTRASMDESVLVTLEDEVWGGMIPDGRQVTRRGRRNYNLPNGTELVVEGMNNWKRIMSTQYDVIAYFECTEDEEDVNWEALTTRLRNQKIPHPAGLCTDDGRFAWHQPPSASPWIDHENPPWEGWPEDVLEYDNIWEARNEGEFLPDGWFPSGVYPDGTPCFVALQLADCNPVYPGHWLNQRPETKDDTTGEPKMLRLLSRHWHNPTVTEDYLRKLRNLTGAKRDRLYRGRWVAESGLVLKEYDRAIHNIKRAQLPSELVYIAGIDWGWDNPGCIQVWGVDKRGWAYRVEEVIRTGEILDWWADVAMALQEEYGFPVMVADPSNPAAIEDFNRRLNGKDRRVPCSVIGAENEILAGLDMLRWALKPADGEEPRLYFVDEAQDRYGRDERLVEERRPTSWEAEAENLLWKKDRDGKPVRKEEPDPKCSDHAIDVSRYIVRYLWRHEPRPKQNRKHYLPGGLGDLLRHDQKWKRIKKKGARRG